MVNFDLRILSAPIEALSPSLNEAYKKLDQEWKSIETALKKLTIPCAISYVFDSDPVEAYGSRLEWRKLRGKKRLCITHFSSGNGPYGYEENEDLVPYEEWSGEQRLEMLKYVPDLFAAAEKQTKDFISKAIGTGGKQ